MRSLSIDPNTYPSPGDSVTSTVGFSLVTFADSSRLVVPIPSHYSRPFPKPIAPSGGKYSCHTRNLKLTITNLQNKRSKEMTHVNHTKDQTCRFGT